MEIVTRIISVICIVTEKIVAVHPGYTQDLSQHIFCESFSDNTRQTHLCTGRIIDCVLAYNKLLFVA